MTKRGWWVAVLLVALSAPLFGAPAIAQDPAAGVVARGDSVTIRLVDADLRSVVQVLSRYLDRPVVFGSIGAARVTIETPRPVATSEIARLLRGTIESQGYELVADTAAGLYRVRQKEPPRPAAPAAETRSTGAAQGVQLFVLRLHHARAADVAAIVNALYGRGSALGERASERGQPLSRELGQNLVPPAGVAAAPDAVPAVAGRQASFVGEVTIVPDARANSLLIRATQADYELVSAAVRELDVRPLQVLITVTIAEVRKDRSFSLGVSASAPETPIGRGNGTVRGSTTGGGAADVVIDLFNLGRHDIDLQLRAAAARGDVRILSRPIVIAANNEEAEINVGSQRPFVQVARVLPTDNTARDQVVQYRDVGTRLTVRPTISTDGYVMLRVLQEVNQATEESSGLSGVEAPVISTRSVQTQLLIRDRQTVVLGGLTDKQRDVSQGGVPVLSAIPLLGAAFGRASRRTTETELYLFITPQVIRDDAEAEELSKPLKERSQRQQP
ncbi:MAG TPA: secretin N-terminal domain-containing protein [Gemmatimonadaceae bacterium]|nr:secretin N-terminal domain-containing protein [Gemmatimonadaceae bacterium]